MNTTLNARIVGIVMLAVVSTLLWMRPMPAGAEPSSAQVTSSVHEGRPLRIVAFGDSITYGFGAEDPDTQSWPAFLGAKKVARSGGCLVVTNCFGRDAAIDIYRSNVLSKRPDVVVLAYGINDLLAGAQTEEIIAGIRTIIAENDARGIQTLVATITPVRVAIDFDPTRRTYNDAIRAAFGAQVLDFDQALAGPLGKLPHRFDSGDGIHPNSRAYFRMAQAARLALQPNGRIVS